MYNLHFVYVRHSKNTVMWENNWMNENKYIPSFKFSMHIDYMGRIRTAPCILDVADSREFFGALLICKAYDLESNKIYLNNIIFARSNTGKKNCR